MSSIINCTNVSVSSLSPNSRNARTHSKKQIGQISRSIREFGFTNPILVDERGIIIAGHGRFEAAKSLGLTEVPAITITGLGLHEAMRLKSEPQCLDCGSVEIVDTDTPDHPFICLSCGYWGMSADQVRDDPHEVPSQTLN